MKVKNASDIFVVVLLALIMASNTVGSMRCSTVGGGKPLAPNGVGSIENYEARIGETGLLIEDDNIQMWVPKRYETHAQVIFGYFQTGYAVLSEIFGGYDMPVKFSIEHYPEGSSYGWGGTDTRGTIRYGYNNLIDDTTEWNKYGIPHVIGYFEEMAHCFVYDKQVGLGSFGFSEAIGMMLGMETGLRVAWNPYIEELNIESIQDCAETTAYYLQHNDGPPDLTPNIWLTRVLVDIFQKEVIDRYGWEAFTKACAQMRQEGLPLRRYDEDHGWGGFLNYLSNATGTDMHSIFASYGLPILEWTGETGYENDGVELVNNQYMFRIRCRDREGTEPAQVMLHLYPEGSPTGETYAMSLVEGSAENGWIYEVVVNIDEPEHYTYAFSAKDGLWDIFQAVGNPTMKKSFGIKGKSFIQACPTTQNVSLGEGVMVEGLLYHIEKSDVWQIGNFDNSSSEFDSNVRDDPETVIFMLGQATSTFPDGLGTDIGPQRSRNEIIFNFSVEQAEFRIRWNPGGSEAQEQFSVFLNGSNLGSSRIVRGSEHPYEWLTEVFNATIPVTGKYNLTLVHNQGDGLNFDYLKLQALEKMGIGNAQVCIEYVAPNMTAFTRTVQTNTTGFYNAVLIPEIPGTWKIRTFWEGNTNYCSAESAKTSLDVIREFKLNIKLPGQIFWCILDSDNVTGEMVSYVTREGLHEIQVVPLITIGPKRWVFTSWSDMNASNPRSIIIEGNTDLLPVYESQYYINATSEHGKASGSGWYAEGSSATVSIDQTTISSGLLTIYVFNGWADEKGEILSASTAYSFTANKPLNLNATWALETNMLPIIIILAIIITIVVGFIYLHSKKKL